jgi:phospholipid transport system substrate-binding protein
MIKLKQLSAACLLLLFSMVSLSAQTPHQRIQSATEAMIKEIPAAKVYFAKDPQRFYAVVDTTLSPLIDFNSFTRSVMGPFGKRDYYASLTPEQRQQFKTNYRQFVETFKAGLIQTYAKGLLVFDGQKITIMPATEADLALIAQGKTVTVIQTINATSDVYTLRYKMSLNKQQQWVLKNVVMESINVGQLYQNQFLSAMKKHNNDFSIVIEQWLTETKQADFTAKNAKDSSQQITQP